MRQVLFSVEHADIGVLLLSRADLDDVGTRSVFGGPLLQEIVIRFNPWNNTFQLAS